MKKEIRLFNTHKQGCVGSFGQMVAAAVLVMGATIGVQAQFTYTSIDEPGASSTWVGRTDGGKTVGQYLNGTGYHGLVYSGGGFTTLDYPGVSFTDITGISGNYNRLLFRRGV
jgi:hypothetical protein